MGMTTEISGSTEGGAGSRGSALIGGSPFPWNVESRMLSPARFGSRVGRERPIGSHLGVDMAGRETAQAAGVGREPGGAEPVDGDVGDLIGLVASSDPVVPVEAHVNRAHPGGQ